MKNELLQSFKHFFWIILMLTATHLQAQVEVSGVITSRENNEPLPGANVVVKGTTTGTISGIDGQYTIAVPSEDAVLVFSFLGYYSQEIPLDDRTQINVQLIPESVSLGDVVVIGYGTQRKEDLTSSIAVLDPQELIKMPGGVTEGLQGSVPGVNVSRGRVRIRGVGSLGDTDPLWVVDGMIVGDEPGSLPNENEIASIQVLKDAASTAIYGSRGANGVIILTTKKGKQGPPKIEYHAYGGTKYPWKTLDMMGPVEFAEYVNEAYYNFYGNTDNTPPAYRDPYNPLASTDWQDEWFRNGWYQNHNLSISGASEHLNYRLGFNYGEDHQTVVRNNNENLKMFVNAEFKKGWITIGESFVIHKYDNAYGGGSYYDLLRTPSNLPVYSDTTDHGYYITGTAETGNDMVNQIGVRHLQDREEENFTVVGNVYAEMNFFQHFTYKLNLGTDIYRGYRYNYDHVYNLGKEVNEDADLSEIAQRNNRFLIENTLTYSQLIGDHSITAMTGVTSETSKWRDMQAEGQGFLASDLRTLANAQDQYIVAGSEREFAQYSMLGRVMYNYKSRYLFTANIRVDGTSNFASSNRYGYFPSASAGWRISGEPIMQQINWLTNLKLRASYGQIGNQKIAPYQYENSVVSANQFYTLGPNQVNVPAPLPKQFGNPGVKWETSTMANIGLDMGILDNTFTFTLDVYDKFTEDLLVEVAIPSSSGSTEKPTLNAGELRNRGLEFSTTYRNTIGGLFFSITGNVATFSNEVLKLGENDDPIIAGDIGIVADNVTRTAVGSSIGRFYTYRTDGIFRSQEELDAHVWENENGELRPIQPNASVGDVKFLDLNNDGRINEADKTFTGSPLPDLSLGLNLSMEFKGFDLAMFWQGDYGLEIFNNGVGLYGHGTSAVNQLAALNDRFRAEDLTIEYYDGEGNQVSSIFLPANTSADIPRAVQGDPNGNFTKPSDLFIEDGSYLRLKRITLGYTFPGFSIANTGIEGLRMYLGAKNLLTFTDYSNYDPEVAGLAGNDEYNLNRGIDMQQSWAPGNITAREFFMGLQVSF